MNEKTQNIIVNIGVVLYIALCGVAIFYPCNCRSEKSVCCSGQQVETTNTQQNTNKENMETMLSRLVPNENAHAQLIWLKIKEDAEIGKLDNYEIEETLEIPVELLNNILDKSHYIDLKDNINTGIYNPLAIVDYIANGDDNVRVVYSFANAQVDFFVNGENVMTGMIYNPDELYNLFESI